MLHPEYVGLVKQILENTVSSKQPCRNIVRERLR